MRCVVLGVRMYVMFLCVVVFSDPDCQEKYPKCL